VITVRPEKPEDVAAVHAVNEEAFGQPAEADIVDVLREECANHVSLVATVEGQVVGHIFFTPVTIPEAAKELMGMGLGPMAVLPVFQRQGIGSRLVRAGIGALRKACCPFIIVVGHPEYYPRFGFVPASGHGLACQWEAIPDDAFMVLILDEGAMTRVSGVARYRDEFNQAM